MGCGEREMAQFVLNLDTAVRTFTLIKEEIQGEMRLKKREEEIYRIEQQRRANLTEAQREEEDKELKERREAQEVSLRLFWKKQEKKDAKNARRRELYRLKKMKKQQQQVDCCNGCNACLFHPDEDVLRCNCLGNYCGDCSPTNNCPNYPNCDCPCEMCVFRPDEEEEVINLIH